MSYLFDVGNSSREFHESKSQTQEALLILRNRKLTKRSFERDRPGARLAPAIDILRNGWGFDIAGDGSVNDPYWLLYPNQSPAKVRTTSEIKNSYWQSEHWLAISNQRWQFDNYRCVLCTSSCREKIQCHHIVYNLFAEKLDELMTVCVPHHEMIHEHSLINFPIGVELWVAERLLNVAAYPFEEWLLP